MSGLRRPGGGAARAFTLLELLVVVALISVLVGGIFAIIPMVRFRAQALETTNRIQQVLTALGTYGRDSGSSAQALQDAGGLGGVIKFDSMEVISQVLRAGGPGRNMPMLIQRPDGSGRFWAVWTDPYVYTFVASSASDVYHGGDEDALQRPKWKDVMDVLPPVSGPVDKSFYLGAWPSSWPDTDWRETPAGTNPPILRFPWGRPGLTLDGGICDPARPPTDIFRRVIEWKNHATFNDATYIWGGQTAWSLNHVDDVPYRDNVPVVNRWVTYPVSGTATEIEATLDPAFLGTGGQQTAPVISPVTGHRSDGTTVTVEANQPLPFDLGWLSPARTIQLLQIAGVLDGTTGEHDYRTDRGPRRAWNDSWGKPLVFSFAVFQPERFQRVCDGQNRRDLLLKKAYDAYGYNRSVYLAGAAIGPDRGDLGATLDALAASGSPAEDRAAAAAIWKRICLTCGAAAWTEGSFTAPPWKGVKIGRKDGMRCFLSTPSEVR